VPSLRLCRELKPFLEQEVTFLLDGGNIGRWAHLLLWDRHPAHWHTCGASGVIGWGLPGAVVARLARPSYPVLLLSGDGSAGFTLGEIETALRFGTPYVAVIAHDGAWGIEADSRPPEGRQGTTLGEIRFDRVAQALGARGVFIESPAQIGPAIAQGLQEDTVTFIHVPTELGGIRYYEEHLAR
jgi:acetolactate synthase-1/2/3 large subunit